MHQEPLAHDRSFHAAAVPGLRSTPLSLAAGRILFILNCKDCRVELRTSLSLSLCVLAVCKRHPCVNSVVEPLGPRERF